MFIFKNMTKMAENDQGETHVDVNPALDMSTLKPISEADQHGSIKVEPFFPDVVKDALKQTGRAIAGAVIPGGGAAATVPDQPLELSDQETERFYTIARSLEIPLKRLSEPIIKGVEAGQQALFKLSEKPEEGVKSALEFAGKTFTGEEDPIDAADLYEGMEFKPITLGLNMPFSPVPIRADVKLNEKQTENLVTMYTEVFANPLYLVPLAARTIKNLTRVDWTKVANTVKHGEKIANAKMPALDRVFSKAELDLHFAPNKKMTQAYIKKVGGTAYKNLRQFIGEYDAIYRGQAFKAGATFYSGIPLNGKDIKQVANTLKLAVPIVEKIAKGIEVAGIAESTVVQVKDALNKFVPQQEAKEDIEIPQNIIDAFNKAEDSLDRVIGMEQGTITTEGTESGRQLGQIKATATKRQHKLGKLLREFVGDDAQKDIDIRTRLQEMRKAGVDVPEMIADLTPQELKAAKNISPDGLKGVTLRRDITVKDQFGKTKNYKAGEDMFIYQDPKTGKAIVKDGTYGILPKKGVEQVEQAGFKLDGGKETDGVKRIVKSDEGVPQEVLDKQRSDVRDSLTERVEVDLEQGTISQEQFDDYMEDIETIVDQEMDVLSDKTPEQTKFSDQVLPGGENYREVLLQAPGFIKQPTREDFLTKKEYIEYQDLIRKDTPTGSLTNIEQKRFDELNKKALDFSNRITEFETAIDKTFTGGHFDEPNVLAHARLDDRVTADGKKVLMIQEIQSDWQAQGRKKGFTSKAWGIAIEKTGQSIQSSYPTKELAQKALKELAKGNGISEDTYRLEEREKDGIPNNPLLKNWQELILKDILARAVEGKYDAISWTTGAQQADRYDLSKQIDMLNYTKQGDTYRVKVHKNGDWHLLPLDGKPLAEVVGKEVAKKIENGEGRQIPHRPEKILEGVDLRIGGEWAINLYDKQIPNILKKLTKGKIGTVDFKETDVRDLTDAEMSELNKLANIRDRTPEQTARYFELGKLNDGTSESLQPQQSLKITPAIRRQVIGQPMAGSKALPEPKPELSIEEKLDEIGNKFKTPETIAKHGAKAIRNEIIDMLKTSGLRPEDYKKFITTLRDTETKEQFDKIESDIRDKIQKLNIAEDKRNVDAEIKKELKFTKPTGAQTSLPKGKFDVESNRFFKNLRETYKINQTNAQAELDRMPTEDMSKVDLIKARFLSYMANGRKGSLELHEQVLADIKKLKLLGKAAKDDIDFENKLLRAEKVDFLSKEIDKVKVLPGQIVVTHAIGNVWDVLNTVAGKNVADTYGTQVLENTVKTEVFGVSKADSIAIANILGLDKPNEVAGYFSNAEHKKYVISGTDDFTAEISVDHIMHMYNAIKNDKIMERWFNEFGDIQVRELIENLTPQEKAVADYWMEELQGYQEIMNKRAIEITGRDMGVVEEYWPAPSEFEQSVFDDIRLQGETAGAIRHRKDNPHIKPKVERASLVYKKGVETAIHVDNLSRPYETLRRLFTDRKIKNQIENKFSEKLYRLAMKKVDGISLNKKSADLDAVDTTYKGFLNNWVGAKITSPSVFATQLGSVINYADSMPVGEWAVGFGEAVGSPTETFNFMWDTLPFLEARFNKGYSEALHDAIKGANEIGKHFGGDWRKGLSIMTRSGDITAIIYGGKPYYDHLLKKNNGDKELTATEFEETTLDTQQSGVSSSLSEAQQNPTGFTKTMFAFKNTATQYVRKMARAIVLYHRGEITGQQLSKTLTIYGILNPIIYTASKVPWWVGTSIALTAIGQLIRKEEVEKPDFEEIGEKVAQNMLSQILSSPFNALPVIDDIATAVAKKLVTGKAPYKIFTYPLLSDLETATRTMLKDEVTLMDWLESLGTAAEMGTSLPAMQAIRGYDLLTGEGKTPRERKQEARDEKVKKRNKVRDKRAKEREKARAKRRGR